MYRAVVGPQHQPAVPDGALDEVLLGFLTRLKLQPELSPSPETLSHCCIRTDWVGQGWHSNFCSKNRHGTRVSRAAEGATLKESWQYVPRKIE